MRVLALPEIGPDDAGPAVEGIALHEIEVKRSRFICALAHVTTEADARGVIAGRRRADPGASHHCTAYVLGDWADITRNSDDGEPPGTAGATMLGVLVRRGLTDVVAVVTRYFGGVKLGAGGLVRAYSRAVSESVDRVGAVEVLHVVTALVTVEHASAGRLLADLHHHGYAPSDVRYGARAEIELDVPTGDTGAFVALVNELTGGRAAVAL